MDFTAGEADNKKKSAASNKEIKQLVDASYRNIRMTAERVASDVETEVNEKKKLGIDELKEKILNMIKGRENFKQESLPKVIEFKNRIKKVRSELAQAKNELDRQLRTLKEMPDLPKEYEKIRQQEAENFKQYVSIFITLFSEALAKNALNVLFSSISHINSY